VSIWTQLNGRKANLVILNEVKYGIQQESS
jgi:hypothetical protein